MSFERFTELANAFGADRSRWPEAERELYGLYADSEQGSALLAQAATLDHLLDAWTIESQQRRSNTHILTTALELRQARRTVAWISTAFAASAVLGFLIGFSQIAPQADREIYVDLMFGDSMMEDIL